MYKNGLMIDIKSVVVFHADMIINEKKLGLFIKNKVKKSIPAALTTLFIYFSILVTLD